MWRRVELKNYRSIAGVRVDLAPLTVLVGPNGSGKSNFVDALVFARDITMDASRAVQTRGGFSALRRWQPKNGSEVMVDIRAAGDRSELDSDFVRYQLTLRGDSEGWWTLDSELMERRTHGETEFSVDRRGNQIVDCIPDEILPLELDAATSAMPYVGQVVYVRGKEALRAVKRFRLDPEAMKQPQIATNVTQLKESGANIAVAVRELRRDPAAFADLRAVLGKIIPGLRDITVERLGEYVSLKFEQEQGAGHTAQFFATQMSDGALRTLGIVVAALQIERDDLLIIEEPEIALHPGAAHLLFQVLEEASRRGAVLVTTHSPDLLDAASESDAEILVCDYRDGTTRIGPMDSGQREIVREGLYSLAELMRSEPFRIDGDPPRQIDPDSLA